MRKLIFPILMLLMLSTIPAGCSGLPGFIENRKPDAGETVKTAEKSETGDASGTEGKVRLTAWVFDDGWENWKSPFEDKYPGMEVIFEYVEGDIIQKYYNAIASGTAPDILLLEENQFSSFNSIEGLEDLLLPPYNAGSMKNDIARRQWDSFLSLDGRRLLGLPVRAYQSVTYYRADIFTEYGFPSEPEEVGNFLQDEENLFNLLYTLKQHDKWVIQWKEDMIFDPWIGFFDKEMNFARNNDAYIKKVEFADRVLREGLVANMNIWSADEQVEIRKGNIPMLFIGDWGDIMIKSWAPESEGKWRAARLPLGNYMYWDVFCLAINSESRHKPEAWNLIRFIYDMEISDRKTRLDKSGNFLGGQNCRALYDELEKKIPSLYLTPLDEPAWSIWYDSLNDYLGSGRPASDVLAEMERLMYQELARERKIILRYLEGG